MSLQLTGTIKQILPVKSGESANGTWSNQEFVIEYITGDRTKHCHFETRGKAMEILAGLTEGQQVEVKFDPDAREYQGKWYGKNGAWAIRVV